MRLTGHESRKIQSGFSLIEVLVSTVVFSIGVLGVTGLAAVYRRTATA
jgi:prepilin-type N-terminal cleavage/methylation domain-containing protein